MDSLRDVLTCPLCAHTLAAPLTLRCGHSLCAVHIASSDPTVCPIPGCQPTLSAPRSGPTVQFHPAPSPTTHPAPRAPSHLGDVTVNKILELIERHSRDAPADDDEDMDDYPPPYASRHRESPPKKRARTADADEDEPDLLSHLSHLSSVQRATRPDAVIPDAYAHPPSSTRNDDTPAPQWAKELLSELTCEICFQLFYEPITTPCQHTFCTKCLQRSLDHSAACPICRQELPGYSYFQDHPVNQTVLSIIQLTNKDLYDARGAAIEQEEKDGRLDTPIFVCQLAFPGMPTLLHFFEPRYRLMLRRCLASPTKSFGMITPPRPGVGTHATLPSSPSGGSSSAAASDTPSSSTTSNAPSASSSSSTAASTSTSASGSSGPPARQSTSVPYPTSHEYGTMLEIRSVQMLPDGRSMVETWGTHRFRILERGVLDGYMVGRVERIDDVDEDFSRDGLELIDEDAEEFALSSGMAVDAPVPTRIGEGSSSRAYTRSPTIPTMPSSTPPLSQLVHTCLEFISTLRKGTAPWVVQRLSSTYGPMPSPRTHISEFSFWMGLVLPIGDEEKARLLPVRSVRMRLVMCCWWIEGLRASWWFSSGCVVL